MYTTLFFDLDHTLWDYKTNSEKTLLHLYEYFDLEKLGIGAPSALFNTFETINEGLWRSFDRMEIDKTELRNRRFDNILQTLLPEHGHLANPMSELFLEHCPKMGCLMHGAAEVLLYLKEKYNLSIITNGFDDTQSTKLKHAGIDHFFDYLITSDSCGAKKPAVEVFDYALQKSGTTKDEVLYVGDNFHTDILGAHGAGWHTIYFNSNNYQPAIAENVATFSIDCLTELRNIL